MIDEALSSAVNEKYLYQKHDNGIHEFVFLEFSRDGADAFMNGYERLAMAIPDGEKPLLLIDSSRGSMPVKYIFDRGRELSQRIPKSKQRYRVAVML